MKKKRPSKPIDGEKLEKERMKDETDEKDTKRLAAIKAADAEDDDEDEEDMDKSVESDAMEAQEEDDGSVDDDDDEDETQKSASDSDRDTLAKAIRILTRHGEMNDPGLRKEALLAKELRGGGLSKSQRSELAGMLMGTDASRITIADEVRTQQAPSASLGKSMVANSAFSESYDNVTKSLALQAEHLDHVTKSLQETNYLMARTLTAMGDTVGAIYDRQEKIGSVLESYGSQPEHAPRSHGLGYAEKSFGGEAQASQTARGGALAKSKPAQIARALDELSKSHGINASQRDAYKMAALGLAMNKQMPPSIAAQVNEYLETAD